MHTYRRVQSKKGYNNLEKKRKKNLQGLANRTELLQEEKNVDMSSLNEMGTLCFTSSDLHRNQFESSCFDSPATKRLKYLC